MMTKPDHHLSAGSAELKNRIATITIDDEGHRNSELQQVLVAGYVALKWALPLQAAVETIDAIAALSGDAAQPEKEKVAAIVLSAILGKADGETYGASHARKMNEDRAEKAAERILAIAAQPPATPVDVRCDNCRITLKPNEVALLCERCRENYPALAHFSAGTDDAGDAATLRGFIKTHGMTPSMMASDRDRWHRVAMEAGAITCVGGTHIYPLRDEVKKLRAEVERLTAEPQAALDRKTIANAVEPILIRRLFERKAEGYTLPMSWEIADAILALSRPQSGSGQ